eukprot:GHVR01080677.1.p1 GENE.GHVR01080677.1~~GHVR01080677.1.p1  ORF type:complete len:109 (-),score=20.48 GHVR01080677.1:118-444(-)
MGRAPTTEERGEIFEDRYLKTPERPQLGAASVAAEEEEADGMSAEVSGVQSQQVEGPTGLPRGGAASWAPQNALTSTPVGQDIPNFVDIGQSTVARSGSCDRAKLYSR